MKKICGLSSSRALFMFLAATCFSEKAFAVTSIMPLGDSITEGYASTATFAQGGYRCPLYSLLNSAKVSFSLVGDSEPVLNPGVVTACSAVNWEGHGGYTIGAIQSWANADDSISALQPNIVLLLGGTNDVAQGITGSITGEMTSLLNDIFARDPNAWVIMSTIPPMNPAASAAAADVAGWATQVPSANTQLKAVAAKYARVTMIDFYSAAVGDVAANIGTDGIHPTVTGYGVLAGLWEQAILARLGESSPSPTPTVTATPTPTATATATGAVLPVGKYLINNGSASVDGGFGVYGITPAVQLYSTNANPDQQWSYQSNQMLSNVGYSGHFMADAGNGTVAEVASGDAFTIVKASSGYIVKDNRTGKYLSDNNGVLAMSATQTVWTFVTESGATPTPSPIATSTPAPSPSTSSAPAPIGNSVTLTVEDSQGFFWDAGNSARGATILQLYQYYKVSTPAQNFVWTPVVGGFTICSDGICLSDNGEQVVMGKQADVWNITSGSAVQNVRTGNYVEQPSSPANAVYLSTGKTPYSWSFSEVLH